MYLMLLHFPQALLGPLPQNVADGGASPPRVCQVLVVDDGSSAKDRGLMLSHFPHFTYVFKGPGDVKGERFVNVTVRRASGLCVCLIS